jgi:hypothetical protein
MRDVIDGASSLCCGMSPGATSSAEFIVAPWEAARCNVNGAVFSSCRTSRELDVIEGTFHRAAGRCRSRRHRRNPLGCVVGRCRGRCHRRNLPGRRRCGVIRGVSCCAVGCRGSTSYAESFVVIARRRQATVAGLDIIGGVPLSRRAAGRRRAQRHRRSLFVVFRWVMGRRRV